VGRAQHLRRVADIDVAHDRKSEEPHRLLTVDEQKGPRVPLSLELRDLSKHPEQADLSHRDAIRAFRVRNRMMHQLRAVGWVEHLRNPLQRTLTMGSLFAQPILQGYGVESFVL